MAGETVVRWATLDDLDFVGQDRFIPADVVRRKIEWREVVVAKRAGHQVGYLRLEYLWSMVPFIALITVLPAFRRRASAGPCWVTSKRICEIRATMHCTARRRGTSRSRKRGTDTWALRSVASSSV